jgi:hypothetical protein
MDKQALLDFATNQMSRLVMKLMTACGAATTAGAQDHATQVAGAVVTLAAFGVELVQSHYAHKVTAQKAVAAAQPPVL